MAFLEQFSDEEKSMIVALPYRAGLWVGQSDSTGGEAADEKEVRALEDIIAEKSRGMFESAFVHEVMIETFARKKSWGEWSNDLDKVPEECTKIVELLNKKLSSKDVDAYRANIMGISLGIAKAFREFNVGAPFFTKVISQIGMFFDALVRLITRDNSYDPSDALNISYEEDQALSALSKALHPENNV